MVGMTDHTYYTDNNAQGGTTYYYRVGSMNAIGTGEMSGQVSVNPLSSPTPWLAYVLVIGVLVVVAIPLVLQVRKRQ